ncbi:MAG: AAA family ATPase [Anaerolineales bacterium]
MDDFSFPYRRVVVVGATGCGKSTLAENLAQRLGLDYIELDALYWKPGWVGSAEEEFRAKVEAATRSLGWALAGNYRVVRDIVWPRAEAVIWLDYPFLLILGRLLGRIWLRWRRKELLWGTNYEPLWVHFKFWSDDSLVKWLFKTYWRRKREYPALFARPEYAHLKVLHFKKPGEMEAWFETL